MSSNSPPPSDPTLRRRMTHAVGWMVLFKGLDRALAIVSMTILARLLVPADFGLVAMATSLIALLEIFAYFGLDTALIQRTEPTPEHYNTAWTLNILTGLTIALAMVALSVPLARYYNEPRVTALTCVLAIGALVQGTENIGIVGFRKELRFDREFRFLLSRKLIAFVATAALAFWWRSYWALAVGTVLGRCGGVALSYILHPMRPRFSLAATGELLNFSKWLVLQNIITFLRDRSSDFVIGRSAGSHALGIFNTAAEISSMPSTELVAPVNRAVYPAYAKLAHDLPALGREYLAVMSMIALLAVPAVVGFAVCAPFLVLLVLGPKWIDAAMLIQTLAFFGLTHALQSNAYSVFLALGRQQVFVRINGVHVALLLPLLIYLTARSGITGAAWAYVIAAYSILPVSFFFVTKAMHLKRRELAARLWRPIVAAALMYFGIRWFGPPSPVNLLNEFEAAIALFKCVALGVPLYGVAIAFLWLLAGRPQGSAESWAVARLMKFVRRG